MITIESVNDIFWNTIREDSVTMNMESWRTANMTKKDLSYEFCEYQKIFQNTLQNS